MRTGQNASDAEFELISGDGRQIGDVETKKDITLVLNSRHPTLSFGSQVGASCNVLLAYPRWQQALPGDLL